MKEIKETTYKGTRILIGNEKRTTTNLMAKYLIEISYDKLGNSKQICGGGEYEGGIGFAIGVDRLLNDPENFDN